MGAPLSQKQNCEDQRPSTEISNFLQKSLSGNPHREQGMDIKLSIKYTRNTPEPGVRPMAWQGVIGYNVTQHWVV
jgi:hypothetical protein